VSYKAFSSTALGLITYGVSRPGLRTNEAANLQIRQDTIDIFVQRYETFIDALQNCDGGEKLRRGRQPERGISYQGWRVGFTEYAAECFEVVESAVEGRDCKYSAGNLARRDSRGE
jgi:hypothetical protein